MKSTIDIAKECGMDGCSSYELNAFRKACEADFLNRCELVTYLKFYSYENGLDREEGFEESSKLSEGSFPVYTLPTITE